MRDLKPGDVVHVQGIVCEIAEIAWLVIHAMINLETRVSLEEGR